MEKISTILVTRMQRLRGRGRSHRFIARTCTVGLGTVYKYTRDITISQGQHHKLKRANMGGIRKVPLLLLKEGRRRGGLNTPSHFKPKYTAHQLIRRIKDFYTRFGRIPTKREFNSHWQCYLKHFGSWNKAIELAGYRTNPVLFARKWVAKDGHRCDSLSEKIIDDWLYKRDIFHERGVFYPGQRKFTVDFLVENKYWIEFLGLIDGLNSYKSLYSRKERLARKQGIKIIKLYPGDLFPSNKLGENLEGLHIKRAKG